MPLWGRVIAAKKYPSLFPDHDAGRVVKEMGVGWSDKKLYRFQYMESVIPLRERHIPPGKLERNVVCGLIPCSMI